MTDTEAAEGPPAHIPRPPNAWILYRSAKIAELKAANGGERTGLAQTTLSKAIAEHWRDETPEVRYRYEQEAELRKLEHRAQNPDWQFKPKRRHRSDEAARALESTMPIPVRGSPSPKRTRAPPGSSSSPSPLKAMAKFEIDATHLRVETSQSPIIRRPPSPVSTDSASELSPDEPLAPVHWPATVPSSPFVPVEHYHARSPLMPPLSDVRHHHSPLPIESPTSGVRLSGVPAFPFGMDDGLASATQRFDSLGLPVEHSSSAVDVMGQLPFVPTGMPVFDDAARYAPIVPDYQFPPRPLPTPPLQAHDPRPAPSPTLQSSAGTPSWWPYRNIRVSRDDSNGVPLHRLLAELAEESERGPRTMLHPQASVELANTYLSGWQ